MIPVGKLLLAAFASMATFGLWKFFQFVYRQLTSPLRNLRGPKGKSWIYGNLQDIWKAEHSALHEEWVKQYGSTLTYKGFFYSNRLFTMDTRAISYILGHSNDYQKPSLVRYDVGQIFGEGVLFAEGAQHRQQRRVLNPAFGPAQIRALTNVFHAKAEQLRNVLSSEVGKAAVGTTTGARIDVIPWLNRATLDIIGLAGFNYNFGAMNGDEKPDELNESFAAVFAAGQTIMLALQAWIPPLRLIPTHRARKIEVANRTMTRIGKRLLSNAKAAVQANATKNGEIGKDGLIGRDMLSLLVKANMATDIPESQRLSDEEVLAQIPTFFLAGHETTSTAITWALYAIAKEPEIQKKLREELLSVDTETPSMDELMALPYLDLVVRETLRMYAPIPSTERVAMKDDVLPVENPYTDKNGIVRDSISIRKGDPIFISIQAFNRSQDLWGPDAHEFKPERWEQLPEAVLRIPGVWAHQLSFLGGPRACIGFRFSLVEIKATLFTLMRAFEFEIAVPASEIGRKSMIVQRPVLLSDPDLRAQLPLLVKPYKQM